MFLDWLCRDVASSFQISSCFLMLSHGKTPLGTMSAGDLCLLLGQAARCRSRCIRHRVLCAGCTICLKVTLLRLLQSASYRSEHAVCEEQGDYCIQKPALPNKMEMWFTDIVTKVWQSSRRMNTPQHKFDTFLAKMGKCPVRKKRAFPDKWDRWIIELVPMPANLRVSLLNQILPALRQRCCGLFPADLLFCQIHTSMDRPERSHAPC